MSYTITKVKNDLTGILKGSTTDKVKNLTEIFNRSAREILLDIDPTETKRTQQITNALYDSVYDYAVPTDLKGNKVIDIRKQVNRDDKFNQYYSEEFDFEKLEGSFHIRHNSGVKTIRIAADIPSGATLHDAGSLTSNGTWTAGGDATNLTVDTLNYVTGASSFNFDLSGATTEGYLEVSDISAVDLTDYEDNSAVFVWVYIPDTSIITSFTLRWGSDSSNYWSGSVTEAQTGAFVTGWNLLRFDWNGDTTETGSPTVTAIDYLRFIVTYDGTAETDLRIDNIVVRRGYIYNIEYYSKYLFQNSAGTWKEETDDDSDIVNLDTESYNIYLFKVAEHCFAQIDESKNDEGDYRQRYIDAVTQYQRDNKSEAKKEKSTYYTLFKR